MARIVTVMIFCVALNLALSFIAANNEVWKPSVPSYDIISEVNETMGEWDPNLYSGIGMFYIFGDFLRAAAYFLRIIGGVVWMVPNLTQVFFMPTMLAYIVQAIVWLIYFLGFIELIGGRRV